MRHMKDNCIVADYIPVSALALDANTKAGRDIMQAWSRPTLYSNCADFSLAVLSSFDVFACEDSSLVCVAVSHVHRTVRQNAYRDFDQMMCSHMRRGL